MASRYSSRPGKRHVNFGDFHVGDLDDKIFEPKEPKEPKWKDDVLIEDTDIDTDIDLDVDIDVEEAEELVNTEVTMDAESLPALRRCRPIESGCALPGYRYPVWEKRVRLIGETRIDGDEHCFNGAIRLRPQEVFFSSPPTLNREIIVCGFVAARLLTRSRGSRRVALPFQAHFPAWPVRDNDRVLEDLLCFVGSRTCPTMVTAPNGRIRRVCDLKVAFEALIRVFHEPPCPAPPRPPRLLRG